MCVSQKVPDYASWFRPFSYSHVKRNLRFWGCNRWQFFLVANPVSGNLEVQVNQYMNSMGYSHGIFGHEVMDRYLTGDPCFHPYLRRMFEDFTWSISQPMRSIVISWLPDRLLDWESHPQALAQNELFLAPNVEQLEDGIRYVRCFDLPRQDMC